MVKCVGYTIEFDALDLVRLILAETGLKLNADTEVATINVDKGGKGTLVVVPKYPVDKGVQS